jgi:hypothetical protein
MRGGFSLARRAAPQISCIIFHIAGSFYVPHTFTCKRGLGKAMKRSTRNLEPGAWLLVPCLLLGACSPELGLNLPRPPVNLETGGVSSHPSIHKGYVWNGIHNCSRIASAVG